jgi:hypothetical protein
VDVVERVAFDMESDISRAFSKKRKKDRECTSKDLESKHGTG